MSDLTTVVEIDPKYDGVYDLRIQAYFHQKDYDKSWADAETAEALGQSVDMMVKMEMMMRDRTRR